jgi:hypothetical protein
MADVMMSDLPVLGNVSPPTIQQEKQNDEGGRCVKRGTQWLMSDVMMSDFPVLSNSSPPTIQQEKQNDEGGRCVKGECNV